MITIKTLNYYQCFSDQKEKIKLFNLKSAKYQKIVLFKQLRGCHKLRFSNSYIFAS